MLFRSPTTPTPSTPGTPKSPLVPAVSTPRPFTVPQVLRTGGRPAREEEEEEEEEEPEEVGRRGLHTHTHVSTGAVLLWCCLGGAVTPVGGQLLMNSSPCRAAG